MDDAGVDDPRTENGRAELRRSLRYGGSKTAAHMKMRRIKTTYVNGLTTLPFGDTVADAKRLVVDVHSRGNPPGV